MDHVEMWIGYQARASSPAHSELDPLHWAPVVTPMGCELITGDIRVDLNTQPSETPF